jgi:hypothetical protein
MKNFHIIQVKYLGPTGTKDSRVKMISERFESSKTIGYDYEFNNSLDVAEDWLSKNGYDIIGHGEGKDKYYIITSTLKDFRA